MHHDFNINYQKDYFSNNQLRKNKTYNNSKQTFFFNDDISSIKTLGIYSKPPVKKEITITERLLSLNEEIELYKTFFLNEMKSLERMILSFDIEKLKSQFENIEKEVFSLYENMKLNERTRMKKAINSIKENEIKKLNEICLYSKEIKEGYMTFQDFQRRVIRYLDKVDYNLEYKFGFLYEFFNKLIESMSSNKKYLSEEQFNIVRKKLIEDINKINMEIVPFQKYDYYK